MRVLSISSSRADVGILAPVWRALTRMPGVELHVLLTGMHLADDTEARTAADGAVIHLGGADLAGTDGAAAAAAMAEIAAAAAKTYAETTPDLILAVGDRLDMIPAVLASVPFNLPVMHLHGGELTLGAVDDRLRHALTKLAHIHCVSHPTAARRICRMGEEPWRIHVTGGPGMDTLLAQPEIPSAELAAEIGLASAAGMRLVTVHPETNSEAPLAPLDATLAALDAAPAPTLVTAPNSDPGGRDMHERILAFVAERPWAAFRNTLGSRLYANALRHAAVMLGNSSSGLIEAPMFGLPVINVGRRQDGRLSSPNVHDCASEVDAVGKLLAEIAASPRPPAGQSPYGDGHAAQRVADVVASLPPRDRLLDKAFFEGTGSFSTPWSEPAAEDSLAAG